MSKFSSYFKELGIHKWPSISPVNTPLIEFPDLNFVIKDENIQPTNSFKDRSIYYQLGYYLTRGKDKFALSSSGNAAISLISLAPSNSEIHLFVSEKISNVKLNKILQSKHKNVFLHKSAKPLFSLNKYVGENPDIVNLRGSRDDTAKVGFRTIAYEISEQYPRVDSIFIPCSSGTSAIGIHEGFEELSMDVAINIVQTTKVNAIANRLKEVKTTNTSLADSIVDRVAHRRNEVLDIIQKTKGDAWIVSDEELVHAHKVFSGLGYDYSYNSLLAYCGYKQSQNSDKKYDYPVLLFSGL